MGSIFHLTQQNGLAEAALKVQWTGQDKKKKKKVRYYERESEMVWQVTVHFK